MHSLPASTATIAEAAKLIDNSQASIDTALARFRADVERLATELEASKSQLEATEDKMQREVRELTEALHAAVYWADNAVPGTTGWDNTDDMMAQLTALHNALRHAEGAEEGAREASGRADGRLRELRRLALGMGLYGAGREGHGIERFPQLLGGAGYCLPCGGWGSRR